MKISFGIPHLGNLPGYFVDSLLQLDKLGVETRVLRVENKPVDIARERISQVFLASEDTHLMWMDSDMKFHPQTLRRLMAHNLPIVSGTYFARTDTPVPHVYRFVKVDDEGVHWYRSLAQEHREYLDRHQEHESMPDAACLPPSPDSLVECDAFGFGCVLMTREVVQAVTEPRFQCFDNGGGEDFFFCEKVRKAGFKVYADWAIQAEHYVTGVFTGREEFLECFKDVEDLTGPVLVEVGRTGTSRFRTGPKIKVAS